MIMLLLALIASDAGVSTALANAAQAVAQAVGLSQTPSEQLRAIRADLQASLRKSSPPVRRTTQVVHSSAYLMTVRAGDSLYRGGSPENEVVPVTSGRSKMTVLLTPRVRRAQPKPQVTVCRGETCARRTWTWEMSSAGAARAQGRADALLGSARGRVVFSVLVAGETMSAPVVIR